MRTESTTLVQTTRSTTCMVETLECRRLASVTLPSVTGHFAGGLSFDNGYNDMIDIQISYQQKAKFSGTFIQGDGSAGYISGTVNKRGVLVFSLQSSNLYNNFKGKAKASLDGSGDWMEGIFATRSGHQFASGTFSAQRVGPDLNEKSG